MKRPQALRLQKCNSYFSNHTRIIKMYFLCQYHSYIIIEFFCFYLFLILIYGRLKFYSTLFVVFPDARKRFWEQRKYYSPSMRSTKTYHFLISPTTKFTQTRCAMNSRKTCDVWTPKKPFLTVLIQLASDVHNTDCIWLNSIDKVSYYCDTVIRAHSPATYDIKSKINACCLKNNQIYGHVWCNDYMTILVSQNKHNIVIYRRIPAKFLWRVLNYSRKLHNLPIKNLKNVST